MCVYICIRTVPGMQKTPYMFAVIGDNDNKNKNLKVCAKLIRMH